MGREATLFVYGTLMRGASHHHLLTGVRDVKTAWTAGRLYQLPEGYPALVDRGEGPVYGEVCRLSDEDEVLSALDAYEGCDPDDPEGSLYQRVVRPVHADDGHRADAWCYVMDPAREPDLLARGASLLASGRWPR